VATPIGNLEDLSPRARRILSEADLILCEDTRTTRKLLSHFGISRPLISYHQHSRLNKSEYILSQLKQGKNLALVSEAGTPGISDPGAELVDYLAKQLPDLKISPIPGPSALAAALSVSGFPTNKFVFLGFPPIKNKRQKFFQDLAGYQGVIVLYESTHRINKTLAELEEFVPTREIVVCRELTKKFETIYRGDLKTVINELKQGETKGEFVIVINHA
jgi:16S rRNA (cytidine1402-2'-O)-methyltransferase